MKIPSYIKTYIKPALASLAVAVIYVAAIPSGCYAAPVKSQNAPFTLIIDPGHGGHDYGAVDNNAHEKDINLGVARKLDELIRKKLKNVKVIMTRSDDTFKSLQERADIANRNKGDLFLSIHTNSVDKSNPNRKTVSGASVYALGPQKDANNLKVAMRENSVIELESNYQQKYSGFDPSKDESYIIFELAQKKTLGKSLKFANQAQKQLVSTAARKDRGVKQAGFWVLWATSMPAVLVELDFICNPESADYLTSESGQQKLAQALFNSIETYIGSNTGSNVTAQIVDVKKPMASTEINEEPEEQNVIASQAKSKGTRQLAQAPKTQNNHVSQRRRRSDSAKKTSDSRQVETSDIPLYSEQENQPEQKETLKAKPSPDTPKTDEGKKRKEKSKKVKGKKAAGKEDKGKEDKGKDNKGTTNRSGQKTFIVKGPASGSSVTTPRKTGSINTKNDSPAPKLSTSNQNNGSPVMVYQIQIGASEKEMSANDPRFCGIAPTGHFTENGLHKYVCFTGSDRRSAEQKLLEIKSVIPDAFIIVRMDSSK